MYVVSEEWISDCSNGADMYVYTNIVKAAAKMRQHVQNDKRVGYISDWKDRDDFMEESGEWYYTAWLENDYYEHQYYVFNEEKEIYVFIL